MPTPDQQDGLKGSKPHVQRTIKQDATDQRMSDGCPTWCDPDLHLDYSKMALRGPGMKAVDHTRHIDAGRADLFVHIGRLDTDGIPGVVLVKVSKYGVGAVRDWDPISTSAELHAQLAQPGLLPELREALQSAAGVLDWTT